MKKFKITYQKEGAIVTKFMTTPNLSKEILPENILTIKEMNTSWFKTLKTQKLKSVEVSELFFELNIILQAKIPIFEALEILEKGTKNLLLKEILLQMMKGLNNGKPLYEVLEVYEKHMGKVVISFFKIVHENGNLSDVVYSLSVLLRSIENYKKLIKRKLSYPMVLCLSLWLSLSVIFQFVIPQFEYIFAQYKTALPLATLTLLGLKSFVVNYFIYMVLFCTLLGFYMLIRYKNSSVFRYRIDKIIITKVPILSQLLFMSYFHRFFLSLKILLEANYKFQNSLINSSILLNNQYLLDKITTLNKRIQSGESMSSAFEDVGLFDELILRLIRTGEKSNSLAISVSECEKIYKQKLDEKIKLFSSVIEPTFIGIIMFLIVWVVLAVLIPLWGIGEVIKV